MTEPQPKRLKTDSQSSLSSPSSSTIVLDEDGDVLLSVIDQQSAKTFLVQSSILRLASPVFATLCYGPFKEATALKQDGNVDIRLEEDDPEAMELILRVLHHKVEGVEIGLPVERLMKVAVQADKYDCVKALTLCMGRWNAILQAVVKMTQSADDLLQALVACYLFRIPGMSEIIVSALDKHDLEFFWRMLAHEKAGLLPGYLTEALSTSLHSVQGFALRKFKEVVILLFCFESPKGCICRNNWISAFESEGLPLVSYLFRDTISLTAEIALRAKKQLKNHGICVTLDPSCRVRPFVESLDEFLKSETAVLRTKIKDAMSKL